ncbi:MAG TPA: hypothetical protein VFS05_14315 [Gemmatimonadaceae bacterium]|nr:hypothetical protein [Gemmatimonadaceae bacterium]
MSAGGRPRGGFGSGGRGAPPNIESAAARQPAVSGEPRRRFRRTLASVMTVQVIALMLLWLLQARYTP